MSLDNERLAHLSMPKYVFAESGTLLFINGAPLSGKSTIAPLVTSSIAGCALQNMDIMRLAAQEIEGLKAPEDRDSVLNFGSCDSYLALGDGSYSPESLIVGYRQYAEATCWLLKRILPKLEVQGAGDVLFEGVQLLPQIVKPYLGKRNKMITITSSPEHFLRNRANLYGAGPNELTGRYEIERLMLIQKELLDQSSDLPVGHAMQIANTGTSIDAAATILKFLADQGTIVPQSDN